MQLQNSVNSGHIKAGKSQADKNEKMQKLLKKLQTLNKSGAPTPAEFHQKAKKYHSKIQKLTK